MKAREPIHLKAEQALKQAVRGVVKRHLQTGRSLAVWKNGKVVQLSAVNASRILKKSA